MNLRQIPEVALGSLQCLETGKSSSRIRGTNPFFTVATKMSSLCS